MAPPEEPNHPNQPNQPPNLPDPMANQRQLNWSYFKPEVVGKAEEDAEAHLLRTNDWMDTHNFPDDQKVRRFCLTLTNEARLWYETIRQVQLDWPPMQECFRQQYSKFGNTREQYFHVWRPFQFDEATDTIDGYIHKVKQVAALLDYGEPQILELFKNILPSRLYYLLLRLPCIYFKGLTHHYGVMCIHIYLKGLTHCDLMYICIYFKGLIHYI